MSRATFTLLALLIGAAPPAMGQSSVGGIRANAFPRIVTVSELGTADGTQGLRIVTDDADCNPSTADDGVVLCLDNGAWSLVIGGGGGADTTCLDAGVDCLFAGSASESGAATSALDLSCTGCVAASEVAADVATQAELDALDTTADDLSDNQLGDLSDVSEVGAAAGEALVSDGVGAWAASASTVCLSDGTNCPADDAGTDDQTATEVPYTPTTGLDWTDPDPTEVGGALDTLAARDAASDDLSDNSVTDLSDVTAISGNTTTLATTSGALGSGNVAAFDAAGNIVDGGAGGGASSSGTGLQYGDGAGAFSEVTDSSVSGGAVTLATGSANGLRFGDGDSGIYEQSDDLIYITLAGTNMYFGTLSGLMSAGFALAGGSGPAMKAAGATATVPTLLPHRGDPDTGICYAGSDDIRVCTGGSSGLGVTAAAVTNYRAILQLAPQASAPATCSIGDLYVDTSGAYCACSATNTWENMTATGSCT